MLRGLIADLDDTLVDTARARALAGAAVRMELASLGLDPAGYWTAYERVEPELFQLVADGGLTKEAYRVRRFADALVAAGRPPSLELAKRLNRIWLEQTTERVTLLPEAQTFLDAAGRSAIPVVVLTNGTSDEQQAKVDASGLRESVRDVLVSDAIGAAKPAREAFERALAVLDAQREDVVMLGNSLPEDVHGAAAAGIPAILIDRGSSFAGYAGARLPDLSRAIEAARALVAAAPT